MKSLKKYGGTVAFLATVALVGVFAAISFADSSAHIAAETTTTGATTTGATTTAATTTAATTTAAAEPNDEIPGTPYTLPGPISDSLNSTSDTDDVYSVQLNAGTSYKVTLVAPAKSAKGTSAVNFGVKLFDSSATSVKTASPILQPSGNQINHFIYKPTVTGTYYLDAHASSGNGSFQLYFATLGAYEQCPGKRVSLGSYSDVTLNPSQNTYTRCYSVAIDSTKAQSLHLRSLKFTGAVAGETNEIDATIIDPNGNPLSTCEGGCNFDRPGTATFKPNRIGLHFFEFQSDDPLPATFSFAVTKKLGTELSLATASSEKKKGGKYRSTAVSILAPKQKNQIISFSFQKCNSSGLKCVNNTTKSVRTNNHGKAKAVVYLSSGRYQVVSKFKGSGKRLSSQSDTDCLAVGATGTCINSNS